MLASWASFQMRRFGQSQQPGFFLQRYLKKLAGSDLDKFKRKKSDTLAQGKLAQSDLGAFW